MSNSTQIQSQTPFRHRVNYSLVVHHNGLAARKPDPELRIQAYRNPPLNMLNIAFTALSILGKS